MSARPPGTTGEGRAGGRCGRPSQGAIAGGRRRGPSQGAIAGGRGREPGRLPPRTYAELPAYTSRMGKLTSLYRAAYRDLPPEVWRLALVAFINRSGTMVVPFLTLWLTGERGYTTGQAGLFLTLYGVGALTGTWLGGWTSDRVAPRRIQIVSLALTGGLFVVLGISRGTAPIALTRSKVLVGAGETRPKGPSSSAASTRDSRGSPATPPPLEAATRRPPAASTGRRHGSRILVGSSPPPPAAATIRRR